MTTIDPNAEPVPHAHYPDFRHYSDVPLNASTHFQPVVMVGAVCLVVLFGWLWKTHGKLGDLEKKLTEFTGKH